MSAPADKLRGLLFPWHGQVRGVELARDEDGTSLAAMYSVLEVQVVECARIADGVDLWFDEEFLLTDGVRWNRGWHRVDTPFGIPPLRLGGNVLALSLDDLGYTRSLNLEQAQLAIELVAEAFAVPMGGGKPMEQILADVRYRPSPERLAAFFERGEAW